MDKEIILDVVVMVIVFSVAISAALFMYFRFGNSKPNEKKKHKEIL